MLRTLWCKNHPEREATFVSALHGLLCSECFEIAHPRRPQCTVCMQEPGNDCEHFTAR